MPFQFEVSNDYGYVIAIALGIVPILSLVQGSVAARLRKDAKVPYPNMYATAQEVKDNPASYKYNCAQRAHGQLLENMPQTIVSMLVAGLEYPRATAALSIGWVVSRALYAHGYITSDKPGGAGRYRGGAFWLFQLGITGICMKSAFDVVTS